MPGDFVCTSANDGTHLFRPITARAHTLWQEKGFINYVIEGNAFLMHQVRRMTGALVDLGRHIMTLEDLIGMIEDSNKVIANSLPSYGLYLDKVYYDDMFSNDIATDDLKVVVTTFDKGI